MALEKEIQQSTFRNEHHKALVNLIYTYNQVSSTMQKILHANNLTMQQFNILRILRGVHPETLTNGQIKDRMLDKSSDVTRIIDRLLKDGYVTRKSCSEDRRRVNITITNVGLKKLEDIDKREKEMDNIVCGISKSEAEKLNILLDKIRSRCNQTGKDQ